MSVRQMNRNRKPGILRSRPEADEPTRERYSYLVRMSAQTQIQLEKCEAKLGRTRNRTLEKAIEFLYRRLFPKAEDAV